MGNGNQRQEIIATTKTCPVCKKASQVSVDARDYTLWLLGEPIQRCFADLSSDQRELFITGLHPDCWVEFLS